MNRLLLIAYVVLTSWCVGAFAWIGSEIVEQRRIFDGVKTLRKAASEEAQADLLHAPIDAPLYIIQELQQEPNRDLKVRLAAVLEKATGKTPKQLDPGNVFSIFANEEKTLEYLLDGELHGVDTSWLTDELRSRLKGFQATSQMVMTPDEQREVVEKVKGACKTLFPELPARERESIRENIVHFSVSRWADLTKERKKRICIFLDSFIRLRFGTGREEEKERLAELLVLNVRSRGEDLLPAEKEWLAEHLSGFLDRILPEAPWKAKALEVSRDYGRHGWAPLVPAESVLFEESRKLRSQYGEQRIRFGKALRESIHNLVREEGGDLNRMMVTELVSLLGNLNGTLTQLVSDSIVILQEARIKRFVEVLKDRQLGEGLAGFQASAGNASLIAMAVDEEIKIMYQPVADTITLLRKTLEREQVPAVMAVRTRTKTKEEHKQELERLLRVARVKSAEVLGRIAVDGAKQAKVIPDPAVRSLVELSVVGECQKVLRGVLGSPSENVVSAAQAALKLGQSGSEGESEGGSEGGSE